MTGTFSALDLVPRTFFAIVKFVESPYLVVCDVLYCPGIWLPITLAGDGGGDDSSTGVRERAKVLVGEEEIKIAIVILRWPNWLHRRDLGAATASGRIRW